MNDYIFYFSLYVGAFLLSVMGLWFTVIVTGIDRFSKRFFISYFLIFMLCCLSSIVEATFQYYIAPRAVYYFMLFLATLLLSLPLPMMTVYLLHCCGENIRSSRLLHAVLGLWAVPACERTIRRWIWGCHTGRSVLPGTSVPASSDTDDRGSAVQCCRHGTATHAFFPQDLPKLRHRPSADGDHADRESLCRCFSAL